METPEISVIIAVYNGDKYITETLESIRLQSFANWECIVVDDGSTDDTIVVIQNYIAQDNRFKIIKTTGGNGPYIAANIGIKEAKGKYIARTDADDVSLPERLQMQYNYLQNNLKINLCGSQHYYLFENNMTNHKFYDSDIKFLKWQLIFRNKIVHSTMMFRKDWFKKIDCYPEKRLAQDWYIWLEASHNNTLYILDVPLVKWRIHENSITKKENSNQLDQGAEVVVYYLKNRLQIEVVDFSIVKNVIGSLRGDKIDTDTDISEIILFIREVYDKFVSDNKIDTQLKTKTKQDLHTIIDHCFAHQSRREIKRVLLYLQTASIAGISKIWLRGFFRLMLGI